MAKNKIKQSRGDDIFDIVNFVLMILVSLLFVYPLIYIVSASFSDPTAVVGGDVWLLPVGFNIEGYKMILDYEAIWTGYGNSILNVLIGVPILMTITVLGAYALSCKEFYIRNFVMVLFTITMFFGGGLIPTYMLLDDLHLIDTRWSIIIPGAVSVYNIIVTRTFFQSSIPNELKEAANLDGCNDLNYFTRIALPLSKPILAVMFMFHTVHIWNMFFNARMYIKDRALMPLQYVLSEIVTSADIDPAMMSGMSSSQAQMLSQISNSIRFGAIIIAAVPVLCIYPFVQKFFVKGIMVGAIKG